MMTDWGRNLPWAVDNPLQLYTDEAEGQTPVAVLPTSLPQQLSVRLESRMFWVLLFGLNECLKEMVRYPTCVWLCVCVCVYMCDWMCVWVCVRVWVRTWWIHALFNCLPSKGEVVLSVENFPVHPFSHLLILSTLIFVKGIRLCYAENRWEIRSIWIVLPRVMGFRCPFVLKQSYVITDRRILGTLNIFSDTLPQHHISYNLSETWKIAQKVSITTRRWLGGKGQWCEENFSIYHHTWEVEMNLDRRLV